MLSEKDKLRLDLSLVSSVMNHAGYKGLLNYMSLEVYKRAIKDEYVNFQKIKDFSFIKDEKTWYHFMDKLVEMKLAVKNGSSYITKSKKKEWKKFLFENHKHCSKFNGFLHFDMSILHKIYKDNDINEMKDLIYLTIVDKGIIGNSTSRAFRESLTGVSPKSQKQIEKRQLGKLVDVSEHHIPVYHLETKDNKVGDIPVFNGVTSTKHMVCHKSTNKKSNCKVIQLGNKLKVKDLNFCSFEYPKTQFQKPKSNLDNLNNHSSKKGEVQDWESFDMVYDLTNDSKTIKARGIVSAPNDTRYSNSFR
jgi:hypothetical protein